MLFEFTTFGFVPSVMSLEGDEKRKLFRGRYCGVSCRACYDQLPVGNSPLGVPMWPLFSLQSLIIFITAVIVNNSISNVIWIYNIWFCFVRCVAQRWWEAKIISGKILWGKLSLVLWSAPSWEFPTRSFLVTAVFFAIFYNFYNRSYSKQSDVSFTFQCNELLNQKVNKLRVLLLTIVSKMFH